MIGDRGVDLQSCRVVAFVVRLPILNRKQAAFEGRHRLRWTAGELPIAIPHDDRDRLAFAGSQPAFDGRKLGSKNVVAADEFGTYEQDEHVGAADRLLNFLAPMMAGLKPFVVPQRKAIFPLNRPQLRQQPAASQDIAVRVRNETVHRSIRTTRFTIAPRHRARSGQ
jgi:hypothetical protein